MQPNAKHLSPARRAAIAMTQQLMRRSLCADCLALLQNPDAKQPHAHLQPAMANHNEAGIDYAHYRCMTCNRDWSRGTDPLKFSYHWTLQAVNNKWASPEDVHQSWLVS
ncbi:hypothetical protein [Andreprevotia chitinilytica]|uniref:hypothetical protein n=1 Tax=Andreprevotia chitinilytica TaxID=396808 RepID=UPI000550F5AE|nr:hypothetical protein [Andreprevotia chitinilytica]